MFTLESIFGCRTPLNVPMRITLDGCVGSVAVRDMTTSVMSTRCAAIILMHVCAIFAVIAVDVRLLGKRRALEN